tara:strand:+ start:283 stop:507 length:225 start_codon:yes stop_codon:yes gene_type:complete
MRDTFVYRSASKRKATDTETETEKSGDAKRQAQSVLDVSYRKKKMDFQEPDIIEMYKKMYGTFKLADDKINLTD